MSAMEVTVIDACMGTGKTTYATMMFNSRDPQEDKFLYITPYLDEVKRIEDNCPGFIQPMTQREADRLTKETGELVEVHPSIKHCQTKGEAIQTLIDNGECITSTHALFKDIGPDVAENIRLQGYTLVMDEVLNPIEQVCFKDEENNPICTAPDSQGGHPTKVDSGHGLREPDHHFHQKPCRSGGLDSIREPVEAITAITIERPALTLAKE